MSPFVVKPDLIFTLLVLLLRLAPSAPVPTTAKDGAVSSNASNSDALYKKEERIINGEAVQEDRYPYSVTLQNGWGHLCGGSLIGNDVILTAAHCTPGSKFSVRIGSNHVDKGVLIGTKRTVRHPNYNENTDEFDIAIVFLKNSITSLSLNIPLVRLNSNSSYPVAGSSVVVMGWGATAHGGDESSFQEDLQEVGLEVISNYECDNFKIGRNSYKGLIHENMLCTYTEGKDACQGDSGGPLIVQGNTPEEDIQVGIVSWGKRCAELPGVFSRISEAYSWMVDTVCNGDFGSTDPPLSLCGGGGADAGVIAPGQRPSSSIFPSSSSTPKPTSEPTLQPTPKPTTLAPSFSPIERPTDSPSVSSEPSTQPSGKLSMKPSLEPSNQPSPRASSQPSLSSRPSDRPSQQPTRSPSIHPSQIPTITVSKYSSIDPSSHSVSSEPSTQPSGEPSMEPSLEPSNQPSPRTSSQPSLSSRPSGRPPKQPSHNPSIHPSQIPTIIISKYSSMEPSLTSSSIPSYSSPIVTTSPTSMLDSLTISASPNVKVEYDETIPGDTLLFSDASADVVDSEETTTAKSSSTMGCSFDIGTLLLCCVTSALMVL